MPELAEAADDRSDPLESIEGRRVERAAAAGDGTLERVYATLRHAIRACRTERDARLLRRALLDALRRLDDQGEDG